jgi:hypothetical protein
MAMPIITHSKTGLCMILIPNKGNTGINSGKSPQCMAHKIDVRMPTPSQFIFIFISQQRYGFAISLQLFLQNESVLAFAH